MKSPGFNNSVFISIVLVFDANPSDGLFQQHPPVRQVPGIMAAGDFGRLHSGVPFWVSVAVLAAAEKCLRLVQVSRPGERIEPRQDKSSPLTHTLVYYRPSLLSSSALLSRQTWFVSFSSQSTGFSSQRAHMFGCSMFGIQVSSFFTLGLGKRAMVRKSPIIGIKYSNVKQ